MIDKINALLAEVNEMTAANAEELEALRIKYLSKKGKITELMADFRLVPPEQKKEVGIRINELKNRAQERMAELKEQFEKMQREIEETEFTASAGGGAVKATMIGTRQLKSIEIDPSAVDPEDVEMLQDMIVAAVNEAIAKSDDATNKAMSKITPMGFPF